MFTGCSLDAHWMLTGCSLDAHWMLTGQIENFVAAVASNYNQINVYHNYHHAVRDSISLAFSVHIQRLFSA
jgi:hypothetical protein